MKIFTFGVAAVASVLGLCHLAVACDGPGFSYGGGSYYSYGRPSYSYSQPSYTYNQPSQPTYTYSQPRYSYDEPSFVQPSQSFVQPAQSFAPSPSFVQPRTIQNTQPNFGGGGRIPSAGQGDGAPAFVNGQAGRLLPGGRFVPNR